MKSQFGSFYRILFQTFTLTLWTFDFDFGFFVKGIFKILPLIHYAANWESLLFADDPLFRFWSASVIEECPFSSFKFDTKASV